MPNWKGTSGRRILVTGANGFLGQHLTRRLLSEGFSVRALVRQEAAGAGLQKLGAELCVADLRDRDRVDRALDDIELVVHAGALSSLWGRFQEFYTTNVIGTRNLVDGALARGVERIIYISSPSVVSRNEDQYDLDESEPYPEKFISVYSQTKALGEIEVAGARERGLSSTILRPKAIYGPGDTAIFPRIIEALSRGRLPRIGDTPTLTNITHVADVVEAIVLAIVQPNADGQTFFVTGGEVVDLWEVIGFIAAQLSLPTFPKTISIPKAMFVAGALERIWKVRNLVGFGGEPPLTRYSVSIFSYSQTYSIAAATQHLGYRPRVAWREGLAGVLDEAQTK